MRMRIGISGGKISAGNSKTRGQTRPPVDSLYQEGDMAYSEQVGSSSSEPVSSGLSECPTIHVELCQKPTRYTYHWLVSLTFTPEQALTPTNYSTLRPCLLRERAVAVLERRGSTFSDLTLTQFDDPLLTEHIMFLAVADIPRHVSVSYSLSVLLCLCHLLSLLSLALSLQPQFSLH